MSAPNMSLLAIALLWVNGLFVGAIAAMLHLAHRLNTGRVAAFKIREWLEASEREAAIRRNKAAGK